MVFWLLASLGVKGGLRSNEGFMRVWGFALVEIDVGKGFLGGGNWHWCLGCLSALYHRWIYFVSDLLYLGP